MRIGVHMRISMGLLQATRKAAEIGCETIQVFAANPSAWRSSPVNPEVAESFRALAEELDLHPVTVHTPYLLNLASPDPEIHGKSTTALADSMARAHMLGAEYLVTHIGSHKGTGTEQGIARVSEGVASALDQSGESVTLLLENSAGAGDSVGSRFEDLCAILDCLEGYGDRLGVCLDTAHLWGTGYDVSDSGGVARVMSEFDSIVGMKRLKLMHLNDTKVPLGGRRDRHANIGTGHIGEQGFAALLNYPALLGLAGVIETPARTIQDDLRDIDILKRLRGMP